MTFGVIKCNFYGLWTTKIKKVGKYSTDLPYVFVLLSDTGRNILKYLNMVKRNVTRKAKQAISQL